MAWGLGQCALPAARESQRSLALKLTVGCYAEKPGTLMRGNLLQLFQDSSLQFLTFPAFSAVFMLDLAFHVVSSDP